MNTELFAQLSESAGMYIPLYPDRGGKQDLRNKDGSPASSFLHYFKRSGTVSSPQNMRILNLYGVI